MWTRDSQYILAPLCDRTSSQKGHIFQETSTNYSIIKTEKKKKKIKTGIPTISSQKRPSSEELPPWAGGSSEKTGLFFLLSGHTFS